MRKALGILILLVLAAPYALTADTVESAAVAETPTCLDATDPGAEAWAALTAPDGWVFAAIGFEQAGCGGTVSCNTVLDCPCPDSRCACIQSPSCGKICLCLTECFEGPIPR